MLLEAGGPTNDDPAVTTPGRWVTLVGSKFDWGYATEPEPGMQNRRIAFPRGKAIGGSSAINAMVFIRGHRLCFDRWKELGNNGWGYDDVLPLFKRSERNESGETEYRGGDGPLAVSYCTDPHASHKAFLAAAWQNGFKADARFDFNEPAPNNVAGYYQRTILDGKRHSASDAFLTPVLSRPNLEVRSQAHAARVIVEGRKAVGVEYVRDGKREQVRAAREIVISSGVIDSPKLLMLSGIGPADHLKSHGITVIADVPGVGQNFQDHLKLSIRWNGKTELPGSTVTAGMFTRSSQGALGTIPDLQFYVGRGLETPDKFITITVSLVQPKSTRRSAVAIGRRDGAADHSRQLPAGAGGRERDDPGRPPRPLVRRGRRICRAARGRDSARRGDEERCRSHRLRAAGVRHHLSRRRYLPDGTAGRRRGRRRFVTSRSRHRRVARGRRVDHAGGGECHHQRGVRDDRRESRRVDLRSAVRPGAHRIARHLANHLAHFAFAGDHGHVGLRDDAAAATLRINDRNSTDLVLFHHGDDFIQGRVGGHRNHGLGSSPPQP